MIEERKSILIVEDSVDIRDLMKLVYQSEGYVVTVASNGQEALDFLRATSVLPGLILLDLMMPSMDGMKFREEQLLDPRIAGLPVFVLTADARGEEKAQAMKVLGFFKKPVPMNQLLDLAEQYC